MTAFSVRFGMADVSEENIERELRHENLMIERGVVRETQRFAREKARGNASVTPGSKSLLKSMAAPLAEIIIDELDRLSSGAVRKKPPELHSLSLLPPRDYAVVALRAVLDAFGGSIPEGKATAAKLGWAIGNAVSAEAQARAFFTNHKQVFERTIRRLEERSSSPIQRVRELTEHYQRLSESNRDLLCSTDKVRVGAFLLTALASLGIVEEHTHNLRKRIVRTYALTDQAVDAIFKLDASAAELKPYLQPTVIPPMPWVNQRTGGYWLPMKSNRLITARFRSNGLAKIAADDMPRMFRALNYLQAIPYRVNRRILDVVNTMRAGHMACEALPSLDLESLPAKPADIETNEESRKAYRVSAREVHTRNNARKGKILAIERTLSVARDLADEPVIYFPKMIDFRGRVYDLPLFLKPQGDDLSKGLLEFGNAKPLGEEGVWWLAIHLANTWGEDKVSFDDRVAWVEANEPRILAAAREPFEERFWMDADSPFQFLAACFEWAGYRDEGPGYRSSIPVALDGSCNGLQHLSAILRDPVGGAAVNLLPAGKPQDIYSEVLRKVVAELERRAEQGEPSAHRWLPLMKRSVVKRPVMTLPYGATKQGFADQIMEDTLHPLEKAGASPFGAEGFEACRYLAAVIWDATGETVVAARQVMDWLQEVAKVASKAGKALSWETPTGFRVVQNYLEAKVGRIELRALGQRVRVHVADGYTTKMNKAKMARAISPNFVHALDAAHMLRTVEHLLDTADSDIHLSMIHDSYGAHAADAGVLATGLRQAFVQMYHERDWLASFRDEIVAQLGPSIEDIPPLPDKGNLQLSDVINSRYFFA
jgi:DNA-directed RNA polymerase